MGDARHGLAGFDSKIDRKWNEKASRSRANFDPSAGLGKDLP